MAAVKRKSVVVERSSNPPAKRPRVETEKTSKKKGNFEGRKGDAESTKASKRSAGSRVTAPVTLPLKEAPAFPRGGGGVLTPLEKKQIQIKASRDALAEQNGSVDLFNDSTPHVAGSESDVSLPETEHEVGRTRRKSKKISGEKKIPVREKTRRIEGLKHKRIVPETLILGRIARVSRRSLTVALPNNLVGHVPLTAVSPQLNARIEKLISGANVAGEEEGTGDLNEEEDETEDVDLDDYFTVGQFLRTSVTSLNDTSANTQPKKKIELSLEPSLANAGLTVENLVPGCTIQASVVSVEDHGLILDLGLESAVRGFLPTQELDASLSIDGIKSGTVLLCIVTAIGSNQRTIKLSTHQEKLKSSAKQSVLKNAPSVDTFLPGTLVELLVSEITDFGLAGKVMGLLDVTADVLHLNSSGGSDEWQSQFQPGRKLIGRLLFSHPSSEEKSLGFSILPQILHFGIRMHADSSVAQPTLSEIVSDAEVVRVEAGFGVYLILPSGGLAFASLSRLFDEKPKDIYPSSGPFALGTKHRIRVLEYNAIDNIFIVSLQRSILERPFLRLEDLDIGGLVTGQVQKLLIGEHGVRGLIVELGEGMDGLVPQTHFSDVILQHPEKRFREGTKVTARVLSVNLERRQVRLTLKKTLVNSDQKIWRDYYRISVGDSAPGTMIKVESYGAIIQFYGDVKGFLPVSEMSEAYIKNATDHFRVGQAVTVSAISVEPERRRLTVTCRDVTTDHISLEGVLASILPGSLVTGTIFQKSEDDLLLRLETSGVIARLTMDHISDGSLRRRQSALSRSRVGQTLQDLLVLDVHAKGRLVILSHKPSLVEAARGGLLLRSFEDLREGMQVTGFVSNITKDGVFVAFAGGISALIPKKQLVDEVQDVEDFGFTKFQLTNTKVLSIDYKGVKPRFWLTMREPQAIISGSSNNASAAAPTNPALTEPIDATVKGLEDLEAGRIVKVRITSVKDTQLNVEIAKNVQGRIDVSEIFDSWDEIKDRKKPLHRFYTGEILTGRILGAHDARNHKFLPISHRSGKTPLLELSAKTSMITNPQAKSPVLSDMKPASSWLAFVNNIGEDCLWVNISPSTRGRIKAIDVADDLSLASELEKNFPVGSAMRVQVVSVDEDRIRLDLSARSGATKGPLVMQDLCQGMVLPGRITRVSDRQLLVQLSDSLVGAVDLIDLADDYALADTTRYQKNDVVRVRIIDLDPPNKKIILSLRPSQVMSSTLPVQDREISSIGQLKVGDVYRGFVKNVTEKGVFVMLGHGVTALVRVTNLSDAYLREWKDQFQHDQLVKGKIITVDQATAHVQMSLKASVLDPNYKAPLSFTDMHVGDVVTGKVVKVESFGVFILVDNSENVRGLCHRSEIAETRIEDVSPLFNEGDAVKAKVLKLDLGQRRINFGMKASYFADVSSENDATGSDASGVRVEGTDAMPEPVNESEDSDELTQDSASGDGSSPRHSPLSEDDVDATAEGKAGLTETKSKTGSLFEGLSFDFKLASASSKAVTKRSAYTSDTEDERSAVPKKKRKRADIQPDRTGDLDAYGPQSADDYERLLLSEPDSSLLWLQYMAFHLDLGDADHARAIGERALKSIGLAQDAEKLNIWIALLNLENAYGDEDGANVKAILERACEYNEPQDIYSRLASIYIQSGKEERADTLFQEMLKKFSQDPKIWVNYATFLFDTAVQADKARDLLPRALGVLPERTHLDMTKSFAQLEFKSKSGMPERGRTIFEGLLSSFPKRKDLYNIMLDLEMKQPDNQERIRSIFERVFEGKVKKNHAQTLFKRWLAFEEKEGDERRTDEVKATAADYLRQRGWEKD